MSLTGTSQFHENELLAYWNIIQRRKWVVFTAIVATVTISAISGFKAPYIYRATAQLLIEKESNVSSYREGVAVDISGMDYYQTQYKIIKSRSIAKRVIDELGAAINAQNKTVKGDPINSFLNNIIVEPIRGSRLVNISAESSSPELAVRIANTLSDVYVKQNLENRLFASREILKKLPADISLASLSNKDVMESLPSVVSNSLIQDLKTELIKYESEYANLSQRYKEKHPSMQTLQAKINLLKERIGTEMRNTVESIKTELSGEYKSNNVRIVDYAEVPKNPVRPQRKRNIIIAFVLGLSLGVGLAFLVEYLDNTFKSGSDIEQYLDVPFLGIVPIVKDKGENNMFVLEGVKSPQGEAIKTIRTNLIFSAAEGKLKTILVTSCVPGEGKTFSSMNIAASFSQAGKKTLLVDTDLRRSSLTKSMKMDIGNGLSNYLIGEADCDQVIRETDVKNLYFISSGLHSPDPAELLGSSRMKEFVTQVSAKFDRVIFDSAPVLPVSDTLNIANLMDGVVMVVYSGKLSRAMVNMGKQKLQGVKAKVVGALLNYVNVKARGYHGYSYYSYSYNEYY